MAYASVTASEILESSARKGPKKFLLSLDTSGFLKIRNAISESTIYDLKQTLSDLKKSDFFSPGISKKGMGKFRYLHLNCNLFNIVCSDYIKLVLKEIIGDFFRLDHAWGIKDNGVYRNNLHGGEHSGQGAMFFHQHMSSNKLSAGVITVGVVIDGVNRRESGGFVFLPGSHKLSTIRTGSGIFNLLNGNLYDEMLVHPELNPGDMVIFPECLVHGTSAMKHGQRTVLYYSFVPGYMRIKNDFPIEELRELYGDTPYKKMILGDAYAIKSESAENGQIWRSPSAST